MNDIIKQISYSNLFSNVNKSDIDLLLKNINFKIVTLIKNEYIFDTLSDSNYICLILSGSVNIEKILPSGKSIFMYSKNKGDIFGEVAAFSDAKHYPCNVISKTDSKLILFKSNEFLNLLNQNSNLLNNFLKIVCNKTYDFNKRVGTLSFTSAKERIVQSILYNFDMDSNFNVKIPFNKHCWANTLNISRASLYRELNTLCEYSLITFITSSTIKILDIKKLEEIVSN